MDDNSEVKSEPLDDYGLEDVEELQNENSSELLEPKLEEPDYYESSEGPPSKLRKFTYNCTLCSISLREQEWVSSRSKDRQLVLVVGALLHGLKSPEEAQSIYPKSRYHICKIHLLEAANDIYNALNIRNVDEMQVCSMDNKEALMIVVNGLAPEYNFEKFKKIFAEYLVKLEKDFKIGGGQEKLQNSSTPSKRKPQTRKCEVCSLREQEHMLYSVESVNRQSVLMVGAILGGKKTMDEAQSAVSGYRYYTCRSHLTEAVDEIFKALNISNIDEMHSCSMDNLMITVNSLSPKCTLAQFKNILIDFTWKLYANENENERESIRKCHRRKCSLCSMTVNDEQVTCFTGKDRKMVVMVTLVLGGLKTIEEAQSVLLEPRYYICKIHLPEVMKEIYKALNIRNVEEMQSCSMEIKKKLMLTVNALCPAHSFFDFGEILGEFVRKAI